MTNTIYVVYGGMDCDCVSFTDKTSFSTLLAYKVWEDRLYEEAEGPVWHHRCSKKAYDEFETESRDLALEAHENGHPWVVYS